MKKWSTLNPDLPVLAESRADMSWAAYFMQYSVQVSPVGRLRQFLGRQARARAEGQQPTLAPSVRGCVRRVIFKTKMTGCRRKKMTWKCSPNQSNQHNKIAAIQYWVFASTWNTAVLLSPHTGCTARTAAAGAHPSSYSYITAHMWTFSLKLDWNWSIKVSVPLVLFLRYSANFWASSFYSLTRPGCVKISDELILMLYYDVKKFRFYCIDFLGVILGLFLR